MSASKVPIETKVSDSRYGTRAVSCVVDSVTKESLLRTLIDDCIEGAVLVGQLGAVHHGIRERRNLAVAHAHELNHVLADVDVLDVALEAIGHDFLGKDCTRR